MVAVMRGVVATFTVLMMMVLMTVIVAVPMVVGVRMGLMGVIV